VKSSLKNSLVSVNTLKGLASLSAAGLALAGGAEAQAAIIVTNVNQDFGFAQGDKNSGTFMLPNKGSFGINTQLGPFLTHRLQIRSKSSNFHFKTTRLPTVLRNNTATFAQRVPAGRTWNQINGSSRRIGVINSVSSMGAAAVGKFTNEYFAFVFFANQSLYGWIKGSLTDNSFAKLTYHLDSYAYDNTGAKIATGQLPAEVPEPATALLALSGALVAGAAGVRRWRAARTAAQQVTAG
jgi:hypothetical protein